MTATAILAIDEGTTGTRAALVHPDGDVTALNYRRLHVDSPAAGVVEQDANAILALTVDAIRATMEEARGTGVEVVATAIATQRATAVLWDAQTGRAVVPAMVWQDSRHAGRLAELGETWNEELLRHVGRPTGVRSPYLWAAEALRTTPEVAELHRLGRLRFGTIDGWLVWNLTKEQRVVASATNATSSGAYRLREHRYHEEYISALGFPAELLPELVDDGAWMGTGREDVFGAPIPVHAVVGDQHAAIIGLGCISAADAMVVHGTGSFCDLVTGTAFPVNSGKYEATLTLTGWRAGGTSTYSVETFTATTGSAFDWICERLGWFDSAKQISELAAQADDGGGVQFVPALTGVRVPRVEPRAKASLTGFTMATTKPQMARALLSGVAQFVRASLEQNNDAAGITPAEVVVGGGMAASDPLVQIQADLTGIPMRRRPRADTASLRGAAYLAGTSAGLLWDDLHEAVAALDDGEFFEPSWDADRRETAVAAWTRSIERELAEAEVN